MTNEQPAVIWTNKLPALIIGVLSLLAAAFVWLYGKSRTATIAAACFCVIGIAFIGYSMTIKDWCKIQAKSDFSAEFGGDFHQCLQDKGWFEP